jgi:quercetin dioxygenase-like cupin family protein
VPESHLERADAQKEKMMSTVTRREAIRTVVGAAVAVSATTSLAASGPAPQVEAADQKAVTVTTVLIESLPDFSDKEMRMMTVEYAPGAASEPHRHPGPVFGYVLAGTVVVQIGDEPSGTYTVGQAFVEPSGAAHMVSRNASATASAKFLAFILADKDEPTMLPLKT